MRPFLFALLCLALAGCSTLKGARLLAPASFGMEPLSPRVYVEPRMTEPQREELQEHLATARQRLHLYFGSVLSEPDIIACASEQCFRENGGESARAKAYAAGKILLSPRGLTAPMIAHEWSHAELSTRTGGLLAPWDIPRWFDEGLAVMVSNEPSHSEEVWQMILAAQIATPPLSELDSREKWLAAVKKYGDTTTNKEQYKVVYATAGHEVRRWYRKAGKAGLGQLLEALRRGKPFAQAYAEAEGSLATDGTSPYGHAAGSMPGTTDNKH